MNILSSAPFSFNRTQTRHDVRTGSELLAGLGVSAPPTPPPYRPPGPRPAFTPRQEIALRQILRRLLAELKHHQGGGE